MKYRKIVYIIIGSLSIFFVMLLLFGILGRFDPETGAQYFLQALQKNNSLQAKMLVSSVKYDFVNEWTEAHDVVKCGLFQWERGSVSGYYPNESEWNGSTSLLCETKSGDFYCLYVKGIVSSKSRFSWIISDWEEIHEGAHHDECKDVPIGNS